MRQAELVSVTSMGGRRGVLFTQGVQLPDCDTDAPDLFKAPLEGRSLVAQGARSPLPHKTPGHLMCTVREQVNCLPPALVYDKPYIL